MRAIKIVLSSFYLLLFSYIVFFARRRTNLPQRYLNWVPIKNTIKDFLKLNPDSGKELYNFYANFLGNIGLFMPVPFIIMLFFGVRDDKRLVILSLLLSILIEMVQFVFKIGVADIDDVLLNTLGAVIGVWMLLLIRKMSYKPGLK